MLEADDAGNPWDHRDAYLLVMEDTCVDYPNGTLARNQRRLLGERPSSLDYSDCCMTTMMAEVEDIAVESVIGPPFVGAGVEECRCLLLPILEEEVEWIPFQEYPQ